MKQKRGRSLFALPLMLLMALLVVSTTVLVEAADLGQNEDSAFELTPEQQALEQQLQRQVQQVAYMRSLQKAGQGQSRAYLQAYLLHRAWSSVDEAASDSDRAARLAEQEVGRQWLQSAQQTSAVDPIVWWWMVGGCPPETSPACDASKALEQLAVLEPENGAVWALLAAQAAKTGQLALQRTYQEKALSAPVVNFYDVALSQLIWESVEGLAQEVPAPQALTEAWKPALEILKLTAEDSHPANMAALGMWAVQPMTLLQARDICPATLEQTMPLLSTKEVAQREQCAQWYAKAANHEQSNLLRALAAHRMQALLATTVEQRQWALQHYLRLVWVVERRAAFEERISIRDLLMLGELRAWEQAPQQTGMSVEPPSTWQPKGKSAQQFIQQMQQDPQEGL